MTTLTETPHPFCFVVSESEGPFYSRDAVTIGLNQTLVPGQVLAALAVTAAVTASAAADSGNTGNGTLALDPTTPVSSAVKDGAYRVVFNAPTTFTVEDPNGREIGKGSTGAAFAKEVKFVVTAGGTAFAAGDAFSVVVGREAVRDEVYVAYDPTATTGAEVARAIAGRNIITDGVSTKRSTVFSGPGEVRASDLTWPAGITAIQKASAIEALRARGIKLR
ncbi:head decoration protein [Methylobacterium aquaticum]|uniref:head decoration protein n=1 Tax=Methylobacterium aquaticum TaxID=270351 RepID=UPI003D168B2D